MGIKGWSIFGGVVVLLIGGLVWLNVANQINVESVNTDTVLSATEESGNIGDQVMGAKDGKNVLVEYGDFQCPTCASAHQPIKDALEKYDGKVTFIFRNFPLTAIHPNANLGALAAESAGLQGKYWEMHDKLYESQTEWSTLSSDAAREKLIEYAGSLNLNVDTFKQDLSSAAVQKKIRFDTALGNKVGVTGTPAIYFNGKLVGKIVDGKMVDAESAPGDAPFAWSTAENLQKYVIDPNLK